VPLRKTYSLLKETVNFWLDANAPTMGAAIAYYTVFSIAPLLMIMVGVAGKILGATAAQGRLAGQIKTIVGPQAADALQTAISSTHLGGNSTTAIIVGAVVLLIGASGVFSEIQSALNIIWGVLPKEGRGIRGVIRDRLFSFLMVLIACLVLLASLVAAAVVAALGNYWIRAGLPDDTAALEAANAGISLLVVTTLFALIYKYLPDAVIGWRDVAAGAIATSALFVLGRYLLSLYLRRTTTASAFGAAGSLAIIMVWVYYTAQIFLFGAAFTRVWANHYGRGVHSRVAKIAEPARNPATPANQSA